MIRQLSILPYLATAALFLSAPLQAADYPTIKDPFSTQKKIAPYGTNLKPASCPAQPSTDKPLALNTVVISTICHNPDARAAYLSLLASADGYDSTVMSYLPDVTAAAQGGTSRFHGNGSRGISQSSSVSASAGMVLYDFGRREATLDIAERSLAAAGLSYDSTLQGFIATSLQNYFALLTSQNALDIESESLAFSKATLDAAETRYKLGLVPVSDVLQSRTNYAQAELRVQQVKNQYELDQAKLAQLMGFTPLTEIAVAELDDSNLMNPPFNSGIVFLIEKAKAQRTDLQTRKLALENAEDSLKNTRRRALPTISASANSGYGDWDISNRRHKRSDTFGVSVTVPIFTGFTEIFNERAQRHQLDAQRLQLTQSERDVEQDVLRSWQNYNTSSKSFEISLSALSSAQQLKDVSLGRYKEGLSSILEILNAELSYRNALQNQLTSRYNLLTTRVDLVRAVGELDLNSVDPNATEPLPWAVEPPPLASVVTFKDPLTQRAAP